MPSSDTLRGLIAAEQNAIRLFDLIEQRQILKPGQTEEQATQAIFDLARTEMGVQRYWHKRIVRSGPNSVLPYDHNPPDRVIQEDDIAWIDLGPVFAERTAEGEIEFEADVGRTYVFGGDERKHRLKSDTEQARHRCADAFRTNPRITGAELFAFACELARQSGWQFGNRIAGHLVDAFPHVKWHGSDDVQYICAENPHPLRSMRNGKHRFWILEMYFVDEERQMGSFFEQLLVDGPASA